MSVGFPVSDNGWVFVQLAEYGFGDSIMLIELRSVMLSEQSLECHKDAN